MTAGCWHNRNQGIIVTIDHNENLGSGMNKFAVKSELFVGNFSSDLEEIRSGRLQIYLDRLAGFYCAHRG